MEKKRRRKALESVFGKSILSGDGINCAVSCPSCDKKKSKRKLVIRLDDGRYHCWVCETKGSNISYLAKKYFSDCADVLHAFSKGRLKQLEPTVQQQIQLPKGAFFIGNDSRDPDHLAAINYLKARGLSKGDIFRWRMLVSSTGRFRRRIIIPSFSEEGQLNYFVSRAIDADKKPKYVNSYVPKKEVVFNEIDVDWTKPVVLVEGVFDAVKSPENTIPILGSSLSRNSKLFHLLTRHACDVTVSLDPDLKSKALDLASQLSKAGCNVKVCFAPNTKDLGSMSKKEVVKVFQSAKYFDPMQIIRHKINGIKSGSII